MYTYNGIDSPEVLQESLVNWTRAQRRGLSIKGANKVRQLLSANLHILRIRFGNDVPMYEKPMNSRHKYY